MEREKSLLRFLTCGSVDDGKSTLIGRLLFDSKLILEDQLATLARDSRKHGTTGEDIDLALLVDGLEAEREQGITIDVAYRFFSTPRRSFIVADTPGHEQYTRNMATGASNSDAAVILIDARKGVLTQTRRHSYICSLLGIRHVAVAINKIDLVDYSAADLPPHRGRLFRLRQVAGIRLDHRHSAVGPLRRQRHGAIGETEVVRGPHAAGVPGRTRCGVGTPRQAVPLPGAMGQPSEPRFPGFFRHGGLRQHPQRRADRRRRLRQGIADHAHRHRGR